MTESEANKLIEDSQYLVGMDITVNFTNEKNEVNRTAACTVLDKQSSFGIGEGERAKHYTVNVIVKEKGTDKEHAISLRELAKEYPNTNKE